MTFQMKNQDMDSYTNDDPRQNMVQMEKDLCRQKESLIAKLSRLTKQRTVLETFADRLTRFPDNEKGVTVVENNVDGGTVSSEHK